MILSTSGGSPNSRWGTGRLTRGFSGVGTGSVSVPQNYSRLNEILFTDPTTPSNGVWSTIRVFDDAQWVYDWLPLPRFPAQNINNPSTEISGNGIETIMGFGIVEPFDWDGSVSGFRPSPIGSTGAGTSSTTPALRSRCAGPKSTRSPLATRP